MALTPKQKVFVDAYCGDAQYNATEAARVAGYNQPSRMGYELLKSKAVLDAIQDRIDVKSKSAWYNELDIQKALWEEVNNKEGRGNTQAARVSALVWLGKSIGMWSEIEQRAKLAEEKAKTPQIQYNIINYAGPKDLKDDSIDVKSIEHQIEENKEQVETTLKSIDSTLEGITIVDYNSLKQKVN